ncbi:MAG: hypothetical protein Kow0037_07590 [Calditrichia bacterium]
MKRQFPIPYRTLQRIKAEEYERFFSALPEYYIYMNHLGEVRWMKEEDALDQHEFFLYDEGRLQRWRRQNRLKKKIDLNRLSRAEKEFRLRIRMMLEEKYLGAVHPETRQELPAEWQFEITDEELDHIPLYLDLDSRVFWRNISIILGVLAIIALLSYFVLEKATQIPTGKLLVHSNVKSARIYLDESTFLGYSDVVLKNVPAGPHRITAIKEGYVAVPSFHEVNLTPDTLTEINFQFRVAQSEVAGLLQVFGEQPGSKLFVDDRYIGKIHPDTLITLEEGQHKISLLKDGYLTQPPEKIVMITAGDTSLVYFQQTILPSAANKAGEGLGKGIATLEVFSNIKGARIYINGKFTGEETDYVFTKHPLGNFRVEVKKEGYDSEPAEMNISLTQSRPVGTARFTLTKKYETLEIETKPGSASIYIDGQFKGSGSFRGAVLTGEHTLSFGEVKGYKTPEEKKISLKPGKPLKINVEYFPVVNVVAGIDNGGNEMNEGCLLQTGYTFPNRSFYPSNEGGPEIAFNDILKQYVWKMGFAFPYRNPRGNDAVKLEFNLPFTIDPREKFTAKISGIATQEKYPLTLKPNLHILVKVNNQLISKYYRPNFVEDVKDLEEISWDITPFIKPGTNTFEISTADDNNLFFLLKRIEIHN